MFNQLKLLILQKWKKVQYTNVKNVKSLIYCF